MSMYRDAMRQAKKQSRPSGVVPHRKPSVSHDTQIQIRRAKVKQAVNRKYAEAVEEDAEGYSTPRTAAVHAAQKSGCPPSWKSKVNPTSHLPAFGVPLRMAQRVRPCRSPYAGSFYLIVVLFPTPFPFKVTVNLAQNKSKIMQEVVEGIGYMPCFRPAASSNAYVIWHSTQPHIDVFSKLQDYQK